MYDTICMAALGFGILVGEMAVGDYEGKEREKGSIYCGGSGDSAKPMEKKGIKAPDAKFKALRAPIGRLNRRKPLETAAGRSSRAAA